MEKPEEEGVLQKEEKNFNWSEIFSGFLVSRSKEKKEEAMMAGMPGHVPYESDMVKEWQPPFLFYRFFIHGIALTILICLCSYMYGIGNGILAGIIPFILPLTTLILIWELNIPHNISLPDTMYMMFLGGTVCFFVISFIGDVTGLSGTKASVFTWPLLTEIGKLLMICLFLRKRSRGYGLNGVLTGAAVGAGFAAFSSVDDIYYVAQYNGQFSGIMAIIIVRIIIIIGGDIVWAAAYGGALALAKGKETLKFKHFGNSLFLICFIGSYLMSVLWNYDITGFFSRFTDSRVAMAFYRFLYVYQGKYILLTVTAWILLLYIARKGVEQVISMADSAMAEKRKWETELPANLFWKMDIYGISGKQGGKKFTCSNQTVIFGRGDNCIVQYPGDTKGISSIHCELRKREREFILIDKTSTYGTFLKNGTKLVPEMPYVLKDGDEFYLASPENTFKVSINKGYTDVLQNETSYRKRTNEVEGTEESGKNFYIACGAIILSVFFGLYATSNVSFGKLGEETTVEKENQSIVGVWKSDQPIDIQSIVLNNIDNVFVELDISIFKDSYADGITFTQDGIAYMTKNGSTIDYAQFTYSIVDDSTIHLQWSYNSPLGLSAGGGLFGMVEAGVSYEIGDQTGYDVEYYFDENNTLVMDFFGHNLTMYRY